MNRCALLGLKALAFVAALVVLAILMAGRLLEAPSRELARADLIVVLGGDNGGRVHHGAGLFSKGIAPLVLLTGLEGGLAETRINYLNWRTRFLADQGVPEGSILIDAVSRSSWEEAVNTLQLMKARRMKSVLVVSDPPHLRRLDWVWSKAFEGSGMEYGLAPTSLPSWNPDRWWQHESSAQYVITEYIKLAYYFVKH